jgi:hypothetical protein
MVPTVSTQPARVICPMLRLRTRNRVRRRDSVMGQSNLNKFEVQCSRPMLDVWIYAVFLLAYVFLNQVTKYSHQFVQGHFLLVLSAMDAPRPGLFQPAQITT